MSKNKIEFNNEKQIEKRWEKNDFLSLVES
jgi:hypothetical protein